MDVSTVLTVVGVAIAAGAWLFPKGIAAPSTSAVAPVLLNSAKQETVEVVGAEKLIEWNWSGERLLREFIALDYDTLPGLTGSDEGNPRQWAPIFTHHPDTWRMLTVGKGEIVGYWHFAPLFDSDYEKALGGQLLDSEITADRVRTIALPGSYKVYFVQFCLRQDHRSLKCKRLLIDSVFNVLEDLAADGAFVAEMAANAYTEIGESLCKEFGLTYLCEHRARGKIYAGKSQDFLLSPFCSRRASLIQKYRQSVADGQGSTFLENK